jgi:hypothetical protein
LTAGDKNTFKNDTITVRGDTGLVLNIKAAVCYLVIISNEGIDINEVAGDTGAIIAPPAVATEDISEISIKTVSDFALSAHPNPFNPTVRINYALKPAVSGVYRIFNLRGQLLFEKELSSSRSGVIGTFSWNGRDLKGRSLTTGFYLGSLETSNGRRLTHKLMLMK